MPFSRSIRGAHGVVGCALAFITLLLSGCFYDHSVTQAIMERRRRAKAAEGAKIRSANALTPKVGLKSGRIRFYVSKEYRQQHSEWRAPLLSLVNAANDILGPNFGVRLEVAVANEWSPACSPSRLEACLRELMQLDPAEDGDWVVGVLGAMPSFTATFDDLGIAAVPGRHFVVRDVSDLVEREAIDRAFDSFTSARREEIYKRRKAHKRLSVFLHEWGHTMGAMHVASSESLLHPVYDDRMESYDEANHGLIEAGLRDRFRYTGKHEELMAYLQGSAATSFQASDREAVLASIAPAPAVSAPSAASATATSAGARTAVAQPDSSPPKHAFLVQGSEEQLLSTLEPADRDTYREAAKLTAANDMFAALKLMSPLAERHPQNYAVQHLACGIAMQTGSQALAQKTCPRVPALASGK